MDPDSPDLPRSGRDDPEAVTAAKRVGLAPQMSIIINVVDGGNALRRLLHAIAAQTSAPSLQILIPFDGSIPETAAIASEFPQAVLIAMGDVRTVRPPSTPAGQHELYDRRRAAGMREAAGTLIAILEDRAVPRVDWAQTMWRLHEELPHAVIGGAIECAPGKLLDWAVWASDYTRYALPFASGPRQWVSDLNVCYKRRALEMTREVWFEQYNEATLHWALAERGETLFLTADAIVDFTTDYHSLTAVLRERFHWGRGFGAVRAQHVSSAQRMRLMLLSPITPVLLWLRHGRVHRRLGHIGRYLRAVPVMAPMLCAWSAGELWGFVTRRP